MTTNNLSDEELDEETRKDLRSILFAIQLIRRETGYGKIEIELNDGQVVEMRAEHKIRPKYLK